MPLKVLFTTSERERLGVLVNNISICAAQLIGQNGPELYKRGLANLAKVRQEDEQVLKRVDELARSHNDESPLRLIEDLPRVPEDVATALRLVCRCLLATAFLGHCLAQPSHSEPPVAALGAEKRLH